VSASWSEQLVNIREGSHRRISERRSSQFAELLSGPDATSALSALLLGDYMSADAKRRAPSEKKKRLQAEGVCCRRREGFPQMDGSRQKSNVPAGT
jgi:hypothetical protein